MKIEDRIKRFKEDIRNNTDKPNEFNSMAFLFSAFYFLYIGMYKYFLVFFALPFILIFLLSQFFDTGVEIFVGILVTHITAAFIANQKIREYKEKYIKKFEHANSDRPVEYYAISIVRLITCTILSGGLYSIYWGYRNWSIYQRTTNDNVKPRLMALLFNFTAISLFNKIRHTTKNKKSFLPQGIACLIIFILEIIIAQALIRNAVSGGLYAFCAVLLLVLMIAYPFCLIPVQQSINKYSADVLKKQPNTYFSILELGILFIGFLMNLTVWFGNYLIQNNTFNAEQAKKVSDAISFIYRHTEGYSTVCQREGYVLENYPNVFQNIYKQEIAQLNLELKKRGYTFERAKSELISSQTADIIASIYNELEQLRKIWIIYDISEDNDIPVRNLEWIENYDGQMSLKEACEIFDEKGIEILQNSENRNYLKSKALR